MAFSTEPEITGWWESRQINYAFLPYSLHVGTDRRNSVGVLRALSSKRGKCSCPARRCRLYDSCHPMTKAARHMPFWFSHCRPISDTAIRHIGARNPRCQRPMAAKARPNRKEHHAVSKSKNETRLKKILAAAEDHFAQPVDRVATRSRRRLTPSAARPRIIPLVLRD